MPWDLTGNTNTNETINFLGTTDSHSLAIRTNNKEAVHVDASGHVGIGTASPSERLTVGGGSLADTKIEVSAGGDQYAALRIKNSQGSWNWQVVPSADSPGGRLRLADETTGREWLAITHTGNVGIGTASPSAKLDVVGDMTVAGAVNVIGNIGGANITGALVTCLNGLNTVGNVSHVGKVHVQGDVACTGDISLTHADCAEDFEVSPCEEAPPGTVMVINDEGILTPSSHAYDSRVAGVVSGAGGLLPGIVLGRHAGRQRTPIALIGRVYCQVDAGSSPIQVGDLLTTSTVPGHAMKATDSVRAFGAVIGKALKPLTQGQGTIPVLVALQ